MPATDPNPGTIDWDAFWREAEGDRRRSANVGQYGKAELLDRFIERVGSVEDLASIGCGPAEPLFELAESHHDVAFYGYDAAASIVEENRERATDAGLENLSFAVDRLPDLRTDRAFDIVYCYATLHYVREAKRAVVKLYDLVGDGGYLVLNYPNRLTRATYRREFADDDAFRERFAQVFAGENLLSYRQLRDLVGRWPRSYWSAVNAPNEPWTGRDNPCVLVPK